MGGSTQEGGQGKESDGRGMKGGKGREAVIWSPTKFLKETPEQ